MSRALASLCGFLCVAWIAACSGGNSSGSGKSIFGSSGSGNSGNGSSGTSSSQQCTDTGYCGPNTDACTCGTSCVHYGPGEYMCGFTCSHDSDCTSHENPINSARYGACQPGLDTSTETYDGYCVPGSSTSGGGGTSGGTTPKSGPECTYQTADTCTCQVTSTPNSTSCEQRYGYTHVCCGDSTWPTSGKCTCTLGLRCSPLGTGADPGCFCALDTTYDDFVSEYQDSPACLNPPGGKCCRDPLSNTCACYTGIVCKAGETQVQDCSVQAKCPSGSKDFGASCQ